MRRAPAAPAALAFALACAGAPLGPPAQAGAQPGEDLVAASRAMSEIEAAEIAGRMAEERQRRVQDVSARPGDAVARFLALYALPRDAESWNGFRSLAQQYPGSAWGHLGMARVYLAWGTLDQAEGEFDRALALQPDNWIARLLRGQARERRERTEEARVDYAAVLAADPQNPEARLGMARILRRAGDAEGAAREAQAALGAFPDHYQALSLLGALALDRGDARQAAAWMQRASASGPRDRQARIAMARLQAELGDTRSAIAEWRAALQAKEDLAGWKALAQLARQAGDAETELQAVRRLTQLEPGAGEHWRRLGELRLLAGDADGAEGALRRVLAKDPRDASSHRSLAKALEVKGDAVGAIGHYREAGEQARSERAALERAVGLEKLPRGDAQALQRAVGRLLDRTYRQRLKARAGLRGVLQLRVSADAEGVATQVDVLGDSVRDGVVLACAYWNLRDASYPKGRAGRYTFRFDLGPTR